MLPAVATHYCPGDILEASVVDIESALADLMDVDMAESPEPCAPQPLLWLDSLGGRLGTKQPILLICHMVDISIAVLMSLSTQVQTSMTVSPRTRNWPQPSEDLRQVLCHRCCGVRLTVVTQHL